MTGYGFVSIGDTTYPVSTAGLCSNCKLKHRIELMCIDCADLIRDIIAYGEAVMVKEFAPIEHIVTVDMDGLMRDAPQ